jgi:hypothetical protein
MPYTVAMDGPIMRIALRDVLTTAELFQMLDAVEQIENAADVTPSRIADLLGLSTAVIDFPALYSIAERRRSFTPKNPIRTAMVATSAVAVGYARMFQTLMTNPHITLEIFDAMDDAERWLRE